MSIYPAVDSNVLTYLVEALTDEEFDPASDGSGIAAESQAMVWCVFHGKCSPWVSPTVRSEYDRIAKPEKRERHDVWARYHFQDQPLTTPELVLQARVA